MLRQFTGAVQPALSLRDTIANWGVIRNALAESPRNRLLQGQKEF